MYRGCEERSDAAAIANAGADVAFEKQRTDSLEVAAVRCINEEQRVALQKAGLSARHDDWLRLLYCTQLHIFVRKCTLTVQNSTHYAIYRSQTQRKKVI